MRLFAGGGLLRNVMPLPSTSTRAPRYWVSTVSKVWRNTLPELPYMVVVPAELILEGRPGDELRPVGIDPVQPLCEPGIYVEAHGRVRKGGDGPLVQWNGVPLQALEVIEA